MLRNKKLMSNLRAFDSFDSICKELDDILSNTEGKQKSDNKEEFQERKLKRSNSIESYVDINYKKYVYRKNIGKKENR